MRQFKNRHEAIQEFRSYRPTDEKVVSFWTKYNWQDWEMGDWVMIQYVKYRDGQNLISRPIYGMFVGVSVWDQALVIHLIEKPRAWMCHAEILTNPELGIYMNLATLDPETEPFELWTSNIKVLGHWKRKPTIGELKKSYKERI